MQRMPRACCASRFRPAANHFAHCAVDNQCTEFPKSTLILNLPKTTKFNYPAEDLTTSGVGATFAEGDQADRRDCLCSDVFATRLARVGTII